MKNKIENHLITIMYACDANGNHKAHITSCVESQTKTFTKNEIEEARTFVKECSYVHDLNEVEKILFSTEKIPEKTENKLFAK